MIASKDRFSPIVGRAIFTVDTIKGKTNDASVATISTTPLLVPLPVESFITSQFNVFTEHFASPCRHYSNDCFTALIALNSDLVGKSWLAVASVGT